MKRARSKSTTHEERVAEWESYVSRVVMVLAPEDGLYERVATHIDKVMTLEKRNQASTTFYYPTSYFCSQMQAVPPQTVIKCSYFSNRKEKYVEFLKVTWKLGEEHSVLLKSLFHDGLKERNYPDSEGVIDHYNKQGGRLSVIINEDKKVTLVYDTSVQELNISFYFRKTKLFIREGIEIWETII
eukprot:TRINITY_DN1880_c0_g1_i4.p1 TRINITY_DN1880_c0_g1~~TRINITY_DN1880_c0_g1_i4.p1  ORF type:complete len:185 (-),score=34.10 TRINITY_DN1880_c0_g1_i4:17-571(-)